MKKIISVSIIILTIINGFVGAQAIIPESQNNVESYVSGVSVGGKVWEKYNDTLKNQDLSLGDQLASGIINRDTILDYSAYLVKFLGEVALLIGALAIIFLGYKRITKNLFQESSVFVKIILGLVIVIFAYVIVKLLWSAFIS